MKKQKIIFTMVLIMFVFVVSAAVTTLTLSSAPGPIGNGSAKGKWLSVCCGPACGVDYCTGNGVYTCCK